MESARGSLRHAAPSPPQVLDSLHRLAKVNCAGHPISYLDFTQEADLVFGICGAHGGYEAAEVRDVRIIGGVRGLCGVPGKRVDEVFPG